MSFWVGYLLGALFSRKAQQFHRNPPRWWREPLPPDWETRDTRVTPNPKASIQPPHPGRDTLR